MKVGKDSAIARSISASYLLKQDHANAFPSTQVRIISIPSHARKEYYRDAAAPLGTSHSAAWLCFLDFSSTAFSAAS
jgi:hypothetical protein